MCNLINTHTHTHRVLVLSRKQETKNKKHIIIQVYFCFFSVAKIIIRPFQK